MLKSIIEHLLTLRLQLQSILADLWAEVMAFAIHFPDDRMNMIYIVTFLMSFCIGIFKIIDRHQLNIRTFTFCCLSSLFICLLSGWLLIAMIDLFLASFL